MHLDCTPTPHSVGRRNRFPRHKEQRGVLLDWVIKKQTIHIRGTTNCTYPSILRWPCPRELGCDPPPDFDFVFCLSSRFFPSLQDCIDYPYCIDRQRSRGCRRTSGESEDATISVQGCFPTRAQGFLEYVRRTRKESVGGERREAGRGKGEKDQAPDKEGGTGSLCAVRNYCLQGGSTSLSGRGQSSEPTLFHHTRECFFGIQRRQELSFLAESDSRESKQPHDRERWGFFDGGQPPSQLA